MDVHHIIGFTISILSVFGGYGCITTGQLVTMLEFSTVSINYRSLMIKEELTTVLGILNIMSFIILFTVFRVILLPYTAFKIIMVIEHTWIYLTPFRKLCYIICCILFTILFLINYYWYFLILRMVGK